MSRDIGFDGEHTYNLQLYFLTNKRIYELVYRWIESYDEIGEVRPREEWRGQFTTPLKELPLRGAELMRMVAHIREAQTTVVALTSSDSESRSEDGSASMQVEVSGDVLPSTFVFIVPAPMPPVHRQEEKAYQDQTSGYVGGRLLPAANNEDYPIREQLYDVIAVPGEWDRSIQPLARVPYKQAFAWAKRLERDEDALIFRYYSETVVPPGKRRDSLEWMNPSFQPWQEPLGFYYRGLYFETANVVELPSEQGFERVPAEVYLATAFQVEGDGVRDVSIYRPFGRRREAIEWLNSIAHVKASITKLIPDDSGTNWFVLSDQQNLNPLGFRQEGDAEWLR